MITIRRAEEKDAEAIEQLAQQIEEPFSRNEFLRDCTNEQKFLFVAENDEKTLIGFAQADAIKTADSPLEHPVYDLVQHTFLAKADAAAEVQKRFAEIFLLEAKRTHQRKFLIT